MNRGTVRDSLESVRFGGSPHGERLAVQFEAAPSQQELPLRC